MTTNYTTLSLADMDTQLEAIAGDARSAFGALDEHQLNWRTDAASWSVAQCLDHLLNANRQMLQAMERALDPSRTLAWWQRLPGQAGLFGSLLIRSQAPGGTRKFKAPPAAVPSSSAIDPLIVDRFVAAQADVAARLRSLADRDPAGTIMVSPYASFITYSVLDGCRIIVTHEHRHVEQARRVTQQPGFPRPS